MHEETLWNFCFDKAFIFVQGGSLAIRDTVKRTVLDNVRHNRLDRNEKPSLWCNIAIGSGYKSWYCEL
jgi:hypothetical protein